MDTTNLHWLQSLLHRFNPPNEERSTKRVSYVPAHAQENDLGLEMTPFERILLGHGVLFCFFLFTLVLCQLRFATEKKSWYS
jgi:hypothetical protein